MRERNKIIIWPLYFDLRKTRSQGRRVPKKFAVPNPNLNSIQAAVEKMGLQYEAVPEASYPRSSWKKTGYISVSKKVARNRLLKEIAEKLSNTRP